MLMMTITAGIPKAKTNRYMNWFSNPLKLYDGISIKLSIPAAYGNFNNIGKLGSVFLEAFQIHF
jgi:hypothetical protein